MPLTKPGKNIQGTIKEKNEGEVYLNKERQRVQGYYVPMVHRTKKEQENQRKKVREYVWRHRGRKDVYIGDSIE